MQGALPAAVNGCVRCSAAHCVRVTYIYVSATVWRVLAAVAAVARRAGHVPSCPTELARCLRYGEETGQLSNLYLNERKSIMDKEHN